jgi:imidazolonepropionase
MRELGIIENGAMLIRNDKIVWAGSREDVFRKASPNDTQVINLKGRVITPGLVDAHTHPIFAGSRLDDYEQSLGGATFAEIAAQGGGIRSTVDATQNADPYDLIDNARRHMNWFVQHGTTTIEAKSGYGGSVEGELKSLRVIKTLQNDRQPKIVATALGAHAIPKDQTASKHVHEVIKHLIPSVAREHLADYFDVFVEKGFFGVEDTRQMALAAKAHGLGIRLHVDQLCDSGNAQLAAELGATTADHLEYVSDEGLKELVHAKVQPVLLPGSVFALAQSHYAPARKMIDEGLAVVISTDFNPGTSPLCSLPLAMSLACTQMRMVPAEALCACTINAAYSIGRGSSIGSLEPDKDADFVVWDCRDYREIAFWLGANLIHSVYIDGHTG